MKKMPARHEHQFQEADPVTVHGSHTRLGTLQAVATLRQHMGDGPPLAGGLT